jgi:hypothetical protein
MRNKLMPSIAAASSLPDHARTRPAVDAGKIAQRADMKSCWLPPMAGANRSMRSAIGLEMTAAESLVESKIHR